MVGKCEFFKKEVGFLGFIIISTEGLRMNPEKLKTITEWSMPKNLNDLRRFIGFTNFYKSFIVDFSKKISRLTDLTKEGLNVEEGLSQSGAQECFQEMISAFSSASFLRHVDFSLKRMIQVNSSAYAFSAVLSQPNEKVKFQPVCFYSKKLSQAERNWQTHDQELGAIVFAFKEWNSWLMGSSEEISVYSDHAILRYFMEARSLTPRQARLAVFLSAFNFSILHLPGKANPADPASRRPDFMEGSRGSEALVLFKSINKDGLGVSSVKMNANEVRFDITFAEPSPEILVFVQAGYEGDEVVKSFKREYFFNDCRWLRGKL